MAEANFYLNTRANSKGLRGILMYFRYHGNQIVISTGKYIKIDDWDKTKQKAKIKFEDHSNLNLRISDIKRDIGFAYSRYELHNSNIDHEELKSIFKQIMFPDTFLLTDKQKDSGLIDFVDHIINSQANIKNADTLKTYRSCRKHLKEFEETIYKKQIIFNDIDLDFFSYFTDFLIVKHDHQNNTLNKYIGILRYFMSEAEERNLHQNYAYKSSRFNVPRTEVDTIYLTTEELNKILNLDLAKNPNLKKAKDLFYIASQTGLRFSAL